MFLRTPSGRYFNLDYVRVMDVKMDKIAPCLVMQVTRENDGMPHVPYVTVVEGYKSVADAQVALDLTLEGFVRHSENVLYFPSAGEYYATFGQEIETGGGAEDGNT